MASLLPLSAIVCPYNASVHCPNYLAALTRAGMAKLSEIGTVLSDHDTLLAGISAVGGAVAANIYVLQQKEANTFFLRTLLRLWGRVEVLEKKLAVKGIVAKTTDDEIFEALPETHQRC